MSDIETPAPALPGYLVVMRRIKRALMALALLAIGVGLLASMDAIAELLFKPANLPSVVLKNRFELSGDLPPALGDRFKDAALGPVNVSVETRPTAVQVVLDDFQIKEGLVGGGFKWKAALVVLPPANPGIYQVQLTLRAPNEPLVAIPAQDVDLYASESERQNADKSICRRLLATDPLDVAVVSLLLALMFGAGFYGVRRCYARRLADHGCLRVYHAKLSGDDTLLYCLDLKNDMHPEERYPIFSAAGELLGTAEVLETDARWAVLRLSAARATAGCIVALSSARCA